MNGKIDLEKMLKSFNEININQNETVLKKEETTDLKVDQLDLPEIKAEIANNETVKEDTEVISENVKVTLQEILEREYKSSNLTDFINLKANEVISANTYQKIFYVAGRVPVSHEKEVTNFKNNFISKVNKKLNSSVDESEFWKVSVGIRVGDIFEAIHVKDFEANDISLEPKKGRITVVDTWKYFHEVNNYLNTKYQLLDELKNIDNNEVDYYSISADTNFDDWRNFIVDSEYIHPRIIQYNQPSIFNKLGVVFMPNTIVINKEGKVVFFGNFNEINLVESIKNMLEDKELKLNGTVQAETDPNGWFCELDSVTKADIVTNINLNMKSQKFGNVEFVILTKYHYTKNKILTETSPIFRGTLFPEQYEMLQIFAIDLESNWNFKNFEFKCSVYTLSGF